MRTDRWIHDTDTEQGSLDRRSHSSVWIDPVVQQNIAASYLVRDTNTTGENLSESREAAQPKPTKPLSYQPSTPLPPRASAQPQHTIKVRPRYSRMYTVPEESDITRIPTMPQPTMWQYETPDYNVESSLSSLSLIAPDAVQDEPKRTLPLAVDEIDTLPPSEKQQKKAAPLLSPFPQRASRPAVVQQERRRKTLDLSKQDTAPIPSQPFVLRAPRGIAELDTAPPGAATVSVPLLERNSRALPALRVPSTVTESEGHSWTTGRGTNSLYAQRIVDDKKRLKGKSTPHLNLVDQARWWLLYPGRIEFLLWLGGAITLMTVTCVFLFVGVFSLGWLSPGVSGGAALSSVQTDTGNRPAPSPTSCTTKNGKKQCTVASSTGTTGTTSATLPPASPQPILRLLVQGPLVQGMQAHLQGQGFSANGQVILTHDENLPCQPETVQADEHGIVNVSITIGVDADWLPGMHSILAYDMLDGHSATTSFSITAPFGKSSTPTPPPGITPTAGGNPTPAPTAVNQTPVPVTPPVGITPTPTQTAPTPTPTVGTTPTPVPTKAPITPTPGITPTVGATPTKTSHITSIQVLSLHDATAQSDMHLPISTWFWLISIGYACSMLLLGIAGVLHKRNRS